MNPNDYLQEVLKSQDLKDESDELKQLQNHRKDVEDLLRKKFSQSCLTIRYGGSRAKGTLIRECYDLDITCYFLNDDVAGGDTLEDIYNNVKSALSESYYVEDKTSALRLKSKDLQTFRQDFHIDVVPGRYTDATKTDVFLHQNGGDKKRLKTNLDVHIAHIKDSGVVDAIRLLKLWKVRRGIQVRQFPFEMMIVDLLKNKKNAGLAKQLEHVWTEMKDRAEAPNVSDPANPTGNDLTTFLDSSWSQLSSVAGTTLLLIGEGDWESVFGAIEKSAAAARVTVLRNAAAAVGTPTKPWCKNA